MNFLVPFYLLGALAVAVPIYLHLRRKPPKDSVEFSSLMFLRSTDYPPVKRSRHLENLPLLLLRCLALLLLAGLFARPFMSGDEEALESGQTRTVLLVDTSASMQRSGLWEAAQAAAAEAEPSEQTPAPRSKRSLPQTTEQEGEVSPNDHLITRAQLDIVLRRILALFKLFIVDLVGQGRAVLVRQRRADQHDFFLLRKLE